MSKKKTWKASFYPECSSTHRLYSKYTDVNGTVEIEDGCLCFRAVALTIRLRSKDFSIPLDQIVQVETMNLNYVFPFGVCVYTKDGKEYMFGHMRNKAFASFIKEAAHII